MMRQQAVILLLLIIGYATALQAQDKQIVYACEGGVAYFNGRNYTPGTYSVKLNGQTAITLQVLTAKRYFNTKKDTIYKGDTFLYRGHYRTFSTLGTTKWNDSLLTVHGCDSVIQHLLTVVERPTTYANLELHICNGDSVEVAGKWYKTNGYNSVTLRGGNYLGGDSVVRFRVTVHKPIVVTNYLTIKQGTQKQWYFHRLSDLPPGKHTLTSANLLHTVYGCDSTEILHVTVIGNTYGNTTIHLCEGETIDYNGNTYSENGTYTTRMANTAGGDSIITLKVYVHQAYDIESDYSIAYQEPLEMGDTIYKDLYPGTYSLYRTCKTQFGCDSNLHYNVEVRRASQQILWHDTRDTVYAGRRYNINVSSTSELPVHLSLSANDKAELADAQLLTLAPGYATIIATQEGNDFYLPVQAEHLFVILRPTDLQTTDNNQQPTKYILNGRLYISDGQQIYNATGIKIN